MERTIEKLLDTSSYSQFLESLLPSQKALFLMFRENFLLTMGDDNLSLNFFLAILSLDSSKKMLNFILKHNYENIPKYLLLIRAPENHVQSGTDKNEQTRKSAISTVERLWKSIHISAQMIKRNEDVGDKVNKMAETFVKQDIKFVSRSSIVLGDDSVKEIKKGRLSVVDKGESFTRLLILKNEFDSMFSQSSQNLIQILRERILPSLMKIKSLGSLPPIIEALSKLARAEAIKDIEKIIGHKIDDSYEHFIQGQSNLLLGFNAIELWSKLLDDNSLLELSKYEKDLFISLIELVNEWEIRHENRSFFHEEVDNELSEL